MITNYETRARKSYVNPRAYDQGKIEDRQQMGFRLASYMGTITCDPHADVLMNGEPDTVRIRDYKSSGNYGRNARTPYKIGYRF